MEMIIGGAYQGKSSYAKKTFPDVKWEEGRELTEEALMHAEGVLGFHEYIRRALKDGEDPGDLPEKLFEKNPNVILVSDEVGYGIVPADAFERQYRETVGRVCTSLAEKSSRVTRVMCGIGTVIKNA